MSHKQINQQTQAQTVGRLSVRLPDGSFVVGDLAVHLSRDVESGVEGSGFPVFTP